MVIFLHVEMADDGRRSSKKPGLLKWMFPTNRSSPSDARRKYSSQGSSLLPLGERRPLRSVPLVGPHYRVEPEILVTEFVEKETKYLGTVTDLPCDFDASDRASLLKIVDEQQTLELLPCQLSYKDDIIVSFSVHNIKLLRRDGERLVHRIETHKIAAVGYVRDDSQHFVFIKFASELNAKMCNLAVLCCGSKVAAEEVCSLAQQVFQLVYTDSTIDFLDKSIMDGAITPKNHSYSTDDSDKKDTVTVSSQEYASYALISSRDSLNMISTSKSPNPDTNGLSNSGQNWAAGSLVKKHSADPLPDIQAGSSATFPQQLKIMRRHRRSDSSGSSNNNVNPVTSASTSTLVSPVMSTQTLPVQLQLQDYITVLKEQLTSMELKKFADLLHQFRTGGITIQEFSSRLLEMYTERRKTLLLGMRHFIPDNEDLTFFNRFLKDNDVEDVTSVPEHSTSSSWWARPPRGDRTFSETEESSASTSINIGPAAGVSLSSSGSERASTSVVSNDDSGEWKDVIVNIQRLGVADASAGPESGAFSKTVNGTPPMHEPGVIVDLPPLCQETTVTRSNVPPVAAVPEGFRDSVYKEEVETSDEVPGAKQKIKKLSRSEKHKLQKRLSSSTSELDQDSEMRAVTLASDTQSEKSQRSKREKRKSTPVKSSSLPGVQVEMTLPERPQSQHGRPQKEHRKKKKHKETAATVEAVL